MVALSFRQPLVLLLVAATTAVHCNAFTVPESIQSLQSRKIMKDFYNLPTSPFRFRGGDATQLEASLDDYSDAARALFGNVIGPAAMLVGGLVPLGFLAGPLPGDSMVHKRLKSLYHMLSVFSLANQLTAIVYATVACNKLTETVVAPAASVFALLQRDYELQWLGVNVHFLAGLLGFMSMICLRAYTLFPKKQKGPATGLAVSALLGMFSIVNRGVAEGNRAGQVFACSIPSLCTRYILLLVKQIQSTGGIMAISALALGTISTIFALKAVWEGAD